MMRGKKIVINIVFFIVVALALLKAFVWFYERNLIYFPSSEYSERPDAAGLRYDEWRLTASDGVSVTAWWIPTDSAGVAVLLLHGNGGNISHRIHLAAGFRSVGFSSCLLDYRGYGSSEGTPSEEGLYRDARAAMARLMQEGYRPESVVLYGESLGGTVASKLATEFPVRGLVLDATFTSPADMSEIILPIIPVRWLLTLDMNTKRRLAEHPVPVIIFHGDQDNVIPFRMGQELFAAASGRKEFVPVAGAQHCAIADVMGSAYFEKIREFIR